MSPSPNPSFRPQGQFIDQERRRARKAFEYAQKGNKECAATYRTVVLKFPTMIKTNGLAYSLAFAYSKRKERAYQLLYQQLSEWLSTEPQEMLQFDTDRKEFIDQLLHLESEELMWATHEVMKLLDWMKRFVGEVPKASKDESTVL